MKYNTAIGFLTAFRLTSRFEGYPTTFGETNLGICFPDGTERVFYGIRVWRLCMLVRVPREFGYRRANEYTRTWRANAGV